MSTISIGNAMRIPKVTTGNAGQYASMRIYDPEAQVCPLRSNFDDYGRWAAHSSINTHAAGCDSAMDIIDVENAHRGGYSEYLNASAIDYPGVGYSDREREVQQVIDNKPFYDTQLGYTYTRGITGEQDTYVAKDNDYSGYGVDAGIGCIMDSTYQNRACDYYSKNRQPPTTQPPM
jgi:hypothetical protein